MKEEEIAERITRYLAAEATPEERAALEAWIAQQADHKATFEAWKAAWEQPLAEASFDTQRGLQQLNARIDADHRLGSKSRRLSFIMKMAASLLLMVAAGVGGYYLHTRAGQQSLVWKQKHTEPGKMTEVTLADGSTVTLHAGSTLKYPEHFGTALREVYLEGEAFFSVSKDAHHPFIVHSGTVTTQVLGTSFNVQAFVDESAIAVTVVTGKVLVKEDAQEVYLQPAQRAVYNKTARSMIKEAANVAEAIAWKENTLIFNDQSLETVARSLARYYGVTIRLENPAVKQCVFTGKFRNESLAHILQALMFSTGVEVVRTPNEILLRGPGCSS